MKQAEGGGWLVYLFARVQLRKAAGPYTHTGNDRTIAAVAAKAKATYGGRDAGSGRENSHDGGGKDESELHVEMMLA